MTDLGWSFPLTPEHDEDDIDGDNLSSHAHPKQVDAATPDSAILHMPGFLAGEEPQMMQEFVDTFLPVSEEACTEKLWVPVAMHHAHHGADSDPATFSLRALAMVRMGYRWGDLRLVRGAEVAYGMALQALQSKLYAGEHGALENKIASCRFLMYYEMFTRNGNATEPDLSWTVHQSGLEHLMQLNQLGQGEQLMDGNMDLLMRSAIVRRKQTQAKMRKTRNIEAQVWEYGLRLAAILGAIDEAQQMNDLDSQRTACDNLATKLVKLDQHLQSWYLALSLAERTGYSQSATEGHSVYWFDSLSTAQAVVLQWTLRILVSRALADFRQTSSLVHSHMQPEDTQTLLAPYSTRQRSDLALQILRCAQYFSFEDHRAAGQLRYSFSYSNAIDALLEDMPTVAANPWLKHLPLNVFSGKGIPIHGLPPAEPPQLFNLCCMSPFVKLYYMWPHIDGDLRAALGQFGSVLEGVCR